MLATMKFRMFVTLSIKKMKCIILWLYIWFPLGVKFGLTLIAKRGLRLFKNRVLREVFGHKREKVLGGLKKF